MKNVPTSGIDPLSAAPHIYNVTVDFQITHCQCDENLSQTIQEKSTNILQCTHKNVLQLAYDCTIYHKINTIKSILCGKSQKDEWLCVYYTTAIRLAKWMKHSGYFDCVNVDFVEFRYHQITSQIYSQGIKCLLSLAELCRRIRNFIRTKRWYEIDTDRYMFRWINNWKYPVS